MRSAWSSLILFLGVPAPSKSGRSRSCFRLRRRPAPPPDLCVISAQQAPPALSNRGNSAGRVYCGQSNNPSLSSLKVSFREDSSFPSTPGSSRATASTITAAAQLPAAHHVIADRNFFVGQMFGHPLIHALIPAADQQQFIKRRITPSPSLPEKFALRRQQHHPLPLACAPATIASTASNKRLRLQQHAFAAAKWPVVHRSMTVVCPVSQIVNPDFQPPRLLRLRDHPDVERARKNSGKIVTM